MEESAWLGQEWFIAAGILLMSNDLQGCRHLPEDTRIILAHQMGFLPLIPLPPSIAQDAPASINGLHPPTTCVHMHSFTCVQTYTHTHVNVYRVCSCHSSVNTGNHSTSPTRTAQHPPPIPQPQGGPSEKRQPAVL